MVSSGRFGLAILLIFLVRFAKADVESRIAAGDPRGKLIFSTLLWRHGDRTPGGFYPTDKFSSPSDWPVGIGQLTNAGRQQHYAFGQWLRERYGDILLPAKYSENDIYVQSTDYDRTIDSAYCNLAGLYPPIDDEIWNKELLWQPIPVHTVPGEFDYILGAVQPNCSVYNKEFDRLSSSPEITKQVNEHISQITAILKNAGESTNVTAFVEMFEALSIRDTVYIETLYKKAVPEWTRDVYPSEWIDKLILNYFTISASTSEIAKFRVGYFWKDLLDRATSKAAGTLSPNLSVYVYSAHDLNIAVVLEALGMFDNKIVQYAACLLFELRVRNNVTYMEIYYKRSYADLSPELLFIPDCGYSCPLEKLYQLYADILPTQDYYKACALPTDA